MARNYNTLSPYYTAAENTLEQYVPLPFQEMMAASNAIYQRGEAIENQKLAADSLINNVEALSSEHRNYVNQRSKGFRDEASKLLEEYGGNAADPEYIRRTKQLIMQYANDNNFKTITSANEKLRFNDKIARQMRAEGKLYVRPQFKGIDDKGNLTDQVGEIEYVNTLDKLKEEYKIAWQSMENNNRGTITNAANIKRQNERVMNSLANQSPEFQKLAQAYVEQGMSVEQALNQVKSDVIGLQGQYGIRSERDNSYYSYQLALRNDARQAEEHRYKIAGLKQQLLQSQGVPQTNPLQGTLVQGAISAKDLNKDKQELATAFRKQIGKDGNLDVKMVSPDVNTNTYSPTGATLGTKHNTTGRITDDRKALGGRSAMEALNYMRAELGWPTKGKKAGSAKQVVDAFERMVKNDNVAPVAYVPGNSSVYNGIERTFGSNFSGATYYKDGEKLKADDSKIIAELEKNKQFAGLSFVNGGSALFKSVSDGKPVTIAVPLDNQTKQVMRSNLHIASIQNEFNDNTQLLKAIKRNPRNFVSQQPDGYYAPRLTGNGLMYAKVKTDGSGNIVDFERDSNNQIKYMDGAIPQQEMLREYNLLDSHLSNIYRSDK